MTIFLESKYTKWYFELVRNPAPSGEKHHIIPKSLGGSNDPDNLVLLTPRQHLIAHKLLVRITSGAAQKKMWYALFMMMNRKLSTFTSREYEKARDKVKNDMSENNPMYREEVLERLRGQKRPSQSEHATKRNVEYWSTRARPLLTRGCAICGTEITTRIAEKMTCSRSCGAKFSRMKRKSGSVLFRGGTHTQ